jgi:hypothetical protein
MDAIDRAGITVVRGSMSMQPARQLILGVRRRRAWECRSPPTWRSGWPTSCRGSSPSARTNSRARLPTSTSGSRRSVTPWGDRRVRGAVRPDGGRSAAVCRCPRHEADRGRAGRGRGAEAAAAPPHLAPGTAAGAAGTRRGRHQVPRAVRGRRAGRGLRGCSIRGARTKCHPAVWLKNAAFRQMSAVCHTEQAFAFGTASQSYPRPSPSSRSKGRPNQALHHDRGRILFSRDNTPL